MNKQREPGPESQERRAGALTDIILLRGREEARLIISSCLPELGLPSQKQDEHSPLP